MAGPSVVYVKRIVWLPRETLEIANGVVLIDGRPLLEPRRVPSAVEHAGRRAERPRILRHRRQPRHGDAGSRLRPRNARTDRGKNVVLMITKDTKGTRVTKTGPVSVAALVLFVVIGLLSYQWW